MAVSLLRAPNVSGLEKSDKLLVVEDNKVVCEQCGWSWAVNQEKRHRTDLLCASCRAKPATVIQYGELRCIPWNGAFDKDGVTPMLDGIPFLPGARICNHLDCCNPKHIVA
jgi:hypothetical protein